jgi:transposase-like protein
MYRDVAQWLDIRHRILGQGAPIRRVAREAGIDPKTVRKMRDQPLPLPYGPRNHRHPKLGPHTATVRRMLKENATLPPRPASLPKLSTGAFVTRASMAGTARLRTTFERLRMTGGKFGSMPMMY